MHRSWTILYIIVPAMMVFHSLYRKTPARVVTLAAAIGCAGITYTGYLAGFVWLDKFNPWSFSAQFVMCINGFLGLWLLIMSIDAKWR